MPAFAEDDPKLVFVPLAEATTPLNGLVHCYKDYWWVVHPTKGLVFHGTKHPAPQCNQNREIVERVMPPIYPWAEIRLIPLVFRRVNPSDYA